MKTKKLSQNVALSICMLSMCLTTQGQTSAEFTSADGVWKYTQDFNSLPSATNSTDTKWETITTLPGWNFVALDKTLKAVAGPTFKSDHGSNSGGSFYNYGINGESNRALGALTSGSRKELTFAVLLKNNTDKTFERIYISFTGEVWRSGDLKTTDESILCTYIENPDASLFDNISYNATIGKKIAALTFNRPDGNDGFADANIDPANSNYKRIPIDGTLPQNQQRLNGKTNIIDIQPGGTILIRWSRINDPLSYNYGLAIDDLEITAQREGENSHYQNQEDQINVYAHDRIIYIDTPASYPFSIVSSLGTELKSGVSHIGKTVIDGIDQGTYIVRIGNKSVKITL